MPDQEFTKTSYEHHEKHYQKYERDESQQKRARSWQQTDTVDAWCRQRIISAIDPILKSYPGYRWLTVGDGRFGSDAHYIEQHGGETLATDISDQLLNKAVEEGYIQKAQRENAENLSFANAEFDFVLCKDSLHHFPRPMIAVYEMLRVSRIGVILIEPNDEFIVPGLVEHIYKNLKELFFEVFLDRKKSRYQYEEVGNFIYGISTRELEKLAAALNFEALATKGINNYYIEGIEDEKLNTHGPLFKRVSFMIAWRNLLSRLGFKSAGILAAIILKNQLSDDCNKALQSSGYRVISLPMNPYLSSK